MSSLDLMYFVLYFIILLQRVVYSKYFAIYLKHSANFWFKKKKSDIWLRVMMFEKNVKSNQFKKIDRAKWKEQL